MHVPSHSLEDVFFGPVGTYTLAPVTRYSKFWDIPVLSNGGQAPGFRNKGQDPGTAYHMLTTLGGTYNQSAIFFQKVLSHFKW